MAILKSPIVYGKINANGSPGLAGYTFPASFRVVSQELKWTIEAAKIPGDDFTKSPSAYLEGRTVIISGLVGAGMPDFNGVAMNTRDLVEAEIQRILQHVYFVGDNSTSDNSDSMALAADPDRRYLPLQIGDSRWALPHVRRTPAHLCLPRRLTECGHAGDRVLCPDPRWLAAVPTLIDSSSAPGPTTFTATVGGNARTYPLLKMVGASAPTMTIQPPDGSNPHHLPRRLIGRRRGAGGHRLRPQEP